MKKYILLLVYQIFILTSCFFYTGVSGSGHYISTNYNATGFYAVKAGDASNVSITKGDFYSVSLTCDDNIISYVNIYSDGYYLNIETLPDCYLYNATISVQITMPDIKALKVEDASHVQVSGFSLNDNLNLMVNGASNLKIYLTDAVDISAAISGASFLQISSIYTVENLDISCSEASTADLKDMVCSYGEITVRSASSLRVNMIGHIIGQVSEASVLYFKGSVSPGPIIFSEASGIVYY